MLNSYHLHYYMFYKLTNRFYKLIDLLMVDIFQQDIFYNLSDLYFLDNIQLHIFYNLIFLYFLDIDQLDIFYMNFLLLNIDPLDILYNHFLNLILSEMNLLIRDEPTNHLDIDSREALEAALEGFEGTIVTVSHDRYFIEKLATRILDLLPSGGAEDISVTRVGQGYEELCRERRKREERGSGANAASEAEAREGSTQKEQYLNNKRAAAEARKAERRRERLSAEAEQIEKELERLDIEMNSEAVATDYLRLAELDTKKNELEERLLEIYEEIGV